MVEEARGNVYSLVDHDILGRFDVTDPRHFQKGDYLTCELHRTNRGEKMLVSLIHVVHSRWMANPRDSNEIHRSFCDLGNDYISRCDSGNLQKEANSIDDRGVGTHSKQIISFRILLSRTENG